MDAKNQSIKTKKLVIYGFMGALSFVLMLFPLPFKYLGFLELDFSDIPAIVIGFIYGPVGAVIVELIKNVIKAITASSTGGVGEMANLAVSIGYVVPCSIVFRKLKKNETVRNIIAALAGILCMCVVGILVNYFITVPLYAKLFGGMDAVIGVTAAQIPAIDSLAKVVILGITPFNVIKGIIISIVGIIVYKNTKFIVKSEKSAIME